MYVICLLAFTSPRSIKSQINYKSKKIVPWRRSCKGIVKHGCLLCDHTKDRKKYVHCTLYHCIQHCIRNKHILFVCLFLVLPELAAHDHLIRFWNMVSDKDEVQSCIIIIHVQIIHVHVHVLLCMTCTCISMHGMYMYMYQSLFTLMGILNVLLSLRDSSLIHSYLQSACAHKDSLIISYKLTVIKLVKLCHLDWLQYNVHVHVHVYHSRYLVVLYNFTNSF